MKQIIIAAFSFCVLVSFYSCEKCYSCQNQCKVCNYTYPDTTLTTQICSDVFGEEYFVEYIDSLTSPSLGWTCRDTLPNRSVRFCGGQSKTKQELINKKAQGFKCAGE